MGYQWGKSPLGASGWKARALTAEERATKFAAEIERLQQELGDARTESNAARHKVEKVNRSAWDVIKRHAGKVEDLRDRSERNAARVRMLAGDLREAREALDDARGRTRQQWRTLMDLRAAREALDDARGRTRQQWLKVVELRGRLDARADRVAALAGALRDAREGLLAGVDQMQQQWCTVMELRRRLEVRADRVAALAGALRDARLIARHLERTLEQEREANRLNVQQLEKSLAITHEWAAEVEKKAAAPAPELVAWETRVRDLEGALRDQQSMTEVWKREAGDAGRAVRMLRGAIDTARFDAAHTKAEADSVLERTEKFGYRRNREG